MHRRSVRTSGFTLVELLIAMAITGIILTAIVALAGGVLRYTGQASTANEMTTELNDVLGYMGLRLRSASQFVGGTDSIQLTDSASTFECSVNASDGNCLGAVVPVVDLESATANITGYQVVAYRVTTVAEWHEDPGIPPGWDGVDTPILLEYRAGISCASPCTAPPTAPSSATVDTVSYVAGGLVLDDGAGGTYVPLTIANPSRAVIRLRLQEGTQLGLRQVPGDGPLALRVDRRQ